MSSRSRRSRKTFAASSFGNLSQLCSDNSSETLPDATARWCPVERLELNQAGSARPESFIPTTPGRCCAAADVAAIASRQCLADDEQRSTRPQAGAATGADHRD